MTITFKLSDDTGLSNDKGTAWVTGWINGGDSTNFKVLAEAFPAAELQASTNPKIFGFAPPQNNQAPFFKLSDVNDLLLSEDTNGNNRLIFTVAKEQPGPLDISGYVPTQYASFPYSVQPGSSVTPSGPFDVFEFGMDAQFDLSAVNGFALNLRFSANGEDFGVRSGISRSQIGTAYQNFITNEAASYSAAQDFAELLYTSAITSGGYIPPLIDKDYFSICDPNDMLAAKSTNYTGSTDDPLATFWDETVAALFTLGNKISINMGSAAAPECYAGIVVKADKPPAGCEPIAFEFKIGSDKKYIYRPKSGLKTAQFVFQQSGFTTPGYGTASTPILSQLQNNLVEAICRGVVMQGVLPATEPLELPDGFSTTAWNNWKNWYPAGAPCHFFAKFLHCSDADGKDSRISGKPSIFHGGAAYGFSMDEDPGGPCDGPNVPSKTPGNIGSGTVTLSLGAWA